MNILFLTNQLNYTDGVSTHLYYLLKHLKKERDMNVFLMCSKGDSADKFKKENIEIIFNNKLDHDIRNIKNYSSAVYSVYRFCRQNSINIIHSHNHYSSNIAGHSSVFLDVKTIQTNHGIIPPEGRLKHFKADYFIAVNERIRKYIIKNHIAPEDRVRLINNGIDFSESKISKKTFPLRIIAASRFDKSKGLDTYIKAVSLLPETLRKNLEIIIAGEGVLENELKDYNKKLKTGIKFIGNQKDLRKILDHTSIFVIPSNSDTEGMPMSMIEAAASENLVISSDFSGVAGILNDGKEGLIFRRNNPEELASKIVFALNNKELSDKMAAEFYAKAKKKFNSVLMCSEHVSYYRKILN